MVAEYAKLRNRTWLYKSIDMAVRGKYILYHHQEGSITLNGSDVLFVGGFYTLFFYLASQFVSVVMPIKHV